jgi:FdhD protein
VAHATVRRTAIRVAADGTPARRQDTLAVEEPLEIRLDGEPFTTTMRTPGHDLDLALGFLVGEAVVVKGDDVTRAAHCADDDGTHNVVTVDLAPGVARPARERHRHVTSACGVCGTATVDEIRARSPHDLRADATRVPAATLARLPETMRAAQRGFDRTGGLHAAALFAPDGRLL